jgi:lysophospholipase L1-like esterase
MTKKLAGLLLLGALAACESSSTPDDGEGTGTGADLSKYVSVGTSISMGVASDGVFNTSQLSSWPALLSADVGVTFTQPLINPPGCTPPFAAPLGSFKRIDNTSITTTNVCSNIQPGIVLPTQNVAVLGATTSDAVNNTGGVGGVTARVLPANQSQVTAMRSLGPTFVSVELGANDVLGALGGLVASGATVTSLSSFSSSYQTVIDNVKATGAKAVLVTLMSDVTRIPVIRTSAEIASQRATLALLNVSVNTDCNTSTNYITLPKLLAAVLTGALQAGVAPYNLSCADVPGTQDYVLTPADITALNALVAQMNTFITAKAGENGYATFSLGALYDTAKDNTTFNLTTILTSLTPFGANISLDAVHPSASGQAILAAAAKAAITSKYGAITK